MPIEINAIIENFEVGFLESNSKYIDNNKLLILTVYNNVLEAHPLIKKEDVKTFENYFNTETYIEIKKDVYKIILSDSIFIFKAYIDPLVKVYIGYLIEKNNVNRVVILNNQLEMQNKYVSI